MISIIVATSKNRVIGAKGKTPWYISEELKRFKEITMGHSIIMGRITHQSIGRALPGRTNIVITRDENFQAEGCIVVNSLDEAMKVAQKNPGSSEIFIIGGGKIYKQALPLTDRIYLTLIDQEIEGDVYFPDYSDFKKVVSESNWQQSGEYRYKFLELER